MNGWIDGFQLHVNERWRDQTNRHTDQLLFELKVVVITITYYVYVISINNFLQLFLIKEKEAADDFKIEEVNILQYINPLYTQFYIEM